MINQTYAPSFGGILTDIDWGKAIKWLRQAGSPNHMQFPVAVIVHEDTDTVTILNGRDAKQNPPFELKPSDRYLELNNNGQRNDFLSTLSGEET